MTAPAFKLTATDHPVEMQGMATETPWWDYKGHKLYIQLWNRDFEGRLFAPCTLDYGSQLHVLGCGSLECEAALMLQMVRKTAAAGWWLIRSKPLLI